MKAKCEPKKLYISKKEINLLTKKLADDIKITKVKYDYIVGIARGGLNISKPLARILKLKHKSIKVSFYGKAMTPFPKIIDLTEIEGIGSETILFVDDLIDAGHTINWLNSNIKEYYNYDVAVLYWNPINRYNITPTHYAAIKPESWIVFPWESAKT
jgi:hypoxanthine phosphoribosyltransferase